MTSTFFERFETSSQAERADMARQLMELYNLVVTAEYDSLMTMRNAKHPGIYGDAAAAHRKACAQLAMIQTVFDVLGIEFEPYRPFDLEVVA